MSNCNDSRDTAYQDGYKDGYQMGKSAGRVCRVRPSKSLRGILESECGNAFPDYYVFCPYCGGELVE